MAEAASKWTEKSCLTPHGLGTVAYASLFFSVTGAT